MAAFNSTFQTDLAKPSRVVPIPDTYTRGDNESHTITVLVYDSANPNCGLMAGSVSAAVARQDGNTIPLTTGTKGAATVPVKLADGSTAQATPCTITLKQACFDCPGQVVVVIRLVSGETITSVFVGSGKVNAGLTNSIIDPGDVITDITALIAAAEQAAEDAEEALAIATHVVRYDETQTMTSSERAIASHNVGAHKIAEVFDPTATYTQGRYVLYLGDLYRLDAASFGPGAFNYSTGGWTYINPTQEPISLAEHAYTDAEKAQARENIGAGSAEDISDLQMTDLQLGGMISDVGHSLAAEYDWQAGTYAVGDYVMSGDKLYRCATAIATPETWTPAHWTEVKLSGEVADLKGAMDSKADYDVMDGILDIDVVRSKNLNKTAYPASGELNSVTFTHNSDGSITMSGTQSKTTRWPELSADIKFLLPAGTYTLSGGVSSSIVLDCNMYANKSDTSTSLQKSSGTDPITFTTAQDYWTYIRITVNSTASPNGVTVYPQLEAGSTATTYQDPNYIAYESTVLDEIEGDISDLETAISEYDTEISGLNDKIDNVTTYEVGKNLVNPATRVVGGLQSSGSISTSGSWASYSTSDFVEVDSDTDYVFSVFNTSVTSPVSTARVLALQYDESKTPISETYQNVDAVGHILIEAGSTTKYVRVCAIATYKFQLEKGENYTDYEAYSGKDVSALPLGTVPMAQSQTGNVLYGKKWVVCGDSFTAGATSTKITEGRYSGFAYVYPYLIGGRNNMEIVRFFAGGRTLAFPAEPGSFTNSLTNPNADCYYQNIPADADYITIYLGINDANHASGSSIDGESTEGQIPLGEITDNTTATYYGAWNVVLTWLITNRPNAHIGIIVCNGNASNDNYRLAQIAIAQKYGIPYIDLNGDERTPAMIRTSNPNIAAAVKTALIEKWRVSESNTHPNDDAHEFESTFIENFLRGI